MFSAKHWNTKPVKAGIFICFVYCYIQNAVTTVNTEIERIFIIKEGLSGDKIIRALNSEEQDRRALALSDT